jgi:hypothetical protein
MLVFWIVIVFISNGWVGSAHYGGIIIREEKGLSPFLLGQSLFSLSIYWLSPTSTPALSLNTDRPQSASINDGLTVFPSDLHLEVMRTV